MRVLVAGATSVLGRYTISELKRRGHTVRALSRSQARAIAAGADEIAIGDALDPETLPAAMKDVDAVISSVGASVWPTPFKGVRGFYAIDVPANVSLIDAAKAAGVKKLVYVSVFGAQSTRNLAYCDAHERVVDHLKQSGLDYGVIRPTAFFSALAEFVIMARRGVVPVFGAAFRTNPIHDRDLALACVDALDHDKHERDVGGDEVVTRRQLAELAIAASGRRALIVSVPAVFLRVASLAAFVFPRVRQMLRFFAHVMSRDLIAPAAGKETLGPYFRDVK